MLTCEFRALTAKDIEKAVERQRRLQAERERIPLV
jgi:hypothetical protein